MKAVLVFVALVAAVSALPTAKNKWEDFPMRHMFIDPSTLNDPNFHPESRILNGREVTPHKIPYQAWLVFRLFAGSSGWTCGGSLITRKFILTAAHCVVGTITYNCIRATLVEVYLGAHDVSIEEPNRVILVATKLTRHPDYVSSTITNDVGLIELDEELELDQYINIAKLPSRSEADRSFEGDNVRVSGWGLTVGGGSRSNVLLAVNSTVLPNAECRQHFTIFQESEICISGEGGVGACNGDSGGPLIAGDRHVGIVSYGRSGCLSGYPSVFARTTSFLPWIEENSDYVAED
ncbi:hypothetical protein NQ315_004391 [Exocentrus adspersus]|uniref:Peptidase S1 domain-containing protein n=1 Tax=Exocentrus adspersus TaxID=1586481 RepID=A0AAV8W7L3_9CUCU|nr:hypothetical protein NQ315_004391 [Exocentrus adspersus]